MILMRPGRPGHDELRILVSRHASKEFRELLDAEGLYKGELLEESASLPPLSEFFVAVGGLGGLAAVLTAFWHRHDGKSFTIAHEGKPIDIKGYSEDAALRMFKEALDELRPGQSE
jgi:hypothetical protein